MTTAVSAVDTHATSSRAPLPSAAEIARLPPDGGREFNRLIHESSPYLLQHARNPVDWYAWGDAAFERARREDKPIFLSVGYSTCHWCHVMERESFERDDVATVLNGSFVCVKVDREERPAVDEIYMNATQVMTGSGGWPNSVWLTPDGRPWFAGTYFPRDAFVTLLTRLAEAWKTRRKDVEGQADELTRMVRSIGRAPAAGSGEQTDIEPATAVLTYLRQTFDDVNGGFGRAPKFPPHHSLRLLLHMYEQSGDGDALRMVTRTLEAMAHGGIRDHVGGGFHRYATDGRWFLPHFEKMLYDNAMLAYAYAEAHRLTGRADYRQVAEETLDWVLRDMTHPRGGFYSALDADSEGEEGRFYVWRRDELTDLLGPAEGALFADVYGASEDGNFHEEATGKRMPANILFLPKPLRAAAESMGIPVVALGNRLSQRRETLREVRDKRAWPHLDDKILVGWNGLMIGAMARAGKALRKPRFVTAARRAADFILGSVRRDGRLLRYWRGDRAKGKAYLDDYAFLADGLLALHDATAEDMCLTAVRELVGVLDEHYRDTDNGGYFLTADDHEALIVRSKDPFDKAIPSGNGVAARVLVRLAEATGEERYAEDASAVFAAFRELMQRQPNAVQTLVLARAMSATPVAELDGVTAFPVTAYVKAAELVEAPGGTVSVPVDITVAEGWHVGAAGESGIGRALSVSLADASAAEIAATRFPGGVEKVFPFGAGHALVYEGTIRLDVDLRIPQTAAEGESQLALEISFQACDDRTCRAPTTLRLPVVVDVKHK